MRTIKKTVVGAFIFSSDNCLLLGRSNRGTYEGAWIIPGGGVEAGETYQQAIIREIYEETHLDISKEKIKRMQKTITGTSKKILKDTGEEVIGDYTFINFIVHIDKNSYEISVTPDDDFVDPIWQPVTELKSIPLPPPTIESLKSMELL